MTSKEHFLRRKAELFEKECVEINVRPHCFYPACEHVDYITLNGFVVTKAATNWAPPTALQDGMIGPHWSKGWLIENCEVSHSKCSGISLGKYFQQHNDNKWSKYKYKDGAQTQRDCSLIAQLDGWSKETIGSHTIRGCDIHDCGQTGIVGNLFHDNCMARDYLLKEEYKQGLGLGEDLFIEIAHGDHRFYVRTAWRCQILQQCLCPAAGQGRAR